MLVSYCQLPYVLNFITNKVVTTHPYVPIRPFALWQPARPSLANNVIGHVTNSKLDV